MNIARFLFFAIVFAMLNSAMAQSLCTTKSGVRLRKSASANAAVTWKVPRHMPLLGTGKRQGNWLEVKDVDGQTHWVTTADVSRRSNCVVVKSKVSRLRTGPGSSYQASPLGVADRYSAFLDLGGEDGWTQVEDEDGETAWVNLDHLWRPTKRTRVSFEGS